jgi:hypothetical protein
MSGRMRPVKKPRNNHDFREPEYKSMLERMWDRFIFAVKPDGDYFRVSEECDGLFVERLTASELRQLGQELVAMANGDFNVGVG